MGLRILGFWRSGSFNSFDFGGRSFYTSRTKELISPPGCVNPSFMVMADWLAEALILQQLLQVFEQVKREEEDVGQP